MDEDEDDEEVEDDDAIDAVSVVDGGIVADRVCEGRTVADLIEGRRSRVGGGAFVLAEPASELEPSPFSFERLSRSFLEVGLGGGLCVSSSFFSFSPSSSSSASSKSKILAKFKPTFGEALNRFTTSAGVGVARVSPVSVRTTPFIAEGMKLVYAGRVMGVSSGRIPDGLGVG